MIIGKFTSNGSGYSGSIQSVGLDVADVTITPVAGKQGNAPDFVVSTAKHEIEIGAAWKKTSKAGKAYLSIKLDGPTLAAPINCALTQHQDGTHVLVWNRREPADEEQAAA